MFRKPIYAVNKVISAYLYHYMANVYLTRQQFSDRCPDSSEGKISCHVNSKF